MGEPLANLDAPHKAEILPFLARLKTALRLPILYVTHATEELASLADTSVLLHAGHVSAAGPVEEIITRSDLPLATRDDAGAVLSACVAEHDGARQLTELLAGSVMLWVSLLDRAIGAFVRMRVPAREVILAAAEPGLTGVHNVIAGRVRAVTPDATKYAVLVEVALQDGTVLLARITPDAIERLDLAVGRDAVALVKSMSIEILPG